MLFGNIVKATRALITNTINCADTTRPITVNCDVVVNGSLNTDDITLTASNTIVGVNAGHQTTSSSSTFIGANSGNDNTTGDLNTCLGRSSGGLLTTGDSNVLLGYRAGADLTDGTNNVCVGLQSGNGLISGSNNVMVGRITGNINDITGCVLLGNSAGASNATDNRLMIDNSSTDSPLLDGDFSSNTLQVNGTATLGQTGNTTNIHEFNGENSNTSMAGSGGALPDVEDFLTVRVNGSLRNIPLFLLSP